MGRFWSGVLGIFLLAGCSVDVGGGDGGGPRPAPRATIDDYEYGRLLAMDFRSLRRRAQAGELGHCEVRNVGYQSVGCATGDSFAVYLKHKGVYFPGMSADVSRSSVCETYVGSNVKEAVQVGLCL